MTKRKNRTKGINTIEHIVNSMSKENGFIIVGIVNTPEQAIEIQGIVRLSVLGFRMQDLPKGV